MLFSGKHIGLNVNAVRIKTTGLAARHRGVTTIAEASGNIFLPRWIHHDGEAMGTLHSGACEDDWAQPREKSCGAERHQFAPSHRSQSVATAFIWNRVRPESITKDIVQR